jgi:hypothetical protein
MLEQNNHVSWKILEKGTEKIGYDDAVSLSVQ